MQTKATISYHAKNKAVALRLGDRLENKVELFRQNTTHPSLRLELLKPKQRGVYSIRINKQYRALLIKRTPGEWFVTDFTDYH